jgi:hypothetical protein
MRPIQIKNGLNIVSTFVSVVIFPYLGNSLAYSEIWQTQNASIA